MSRNRQRIERALREAGIVFGRVAWRPIEKAMEMCGPGGGWMLIDEHGEEIDAIGLNVGEALEWVKWEKGRIKARHPTDEGGR